MKVTGLLVVRLPRLNFDADGRGAFPAHPPCHDGVCYAGIDRMAWFDVDESSIRGVLPPELALFREQIKATNADPSGVQVCQDLDAARALLSFSNRSQRRNEIIVARSPELSELKGTFELAETSVSWLGYDVALVGGWSLVRDWLFDGTGAESEIAALLNEFGLVPASWAVDEVISGYVAAMESGEAEEIPDSTYDFASIEIGRVQLD
jgi:hypothetical protein